MRRHVIALLSIVLLLAPLTIMLTACVPTSSKSDAPTDGLAYKSDITRLDTALGKKADQSAIDAMLKLMPAGGSSIDAYSKSQTYTKAEVDAMIKALKDDQAWITGSIPSTSTPGGTSTSSGGYIVTLDRTQIISMASETSNKDISVTVKNQTGSSKSPSLLVSLTPASPSTFEVTKLNATHRSLKSTLSGFTTAQDGIVQTNPDATTLLKKLYWVAPEFSLGNGDSKSIWFNFDIWTTDVVTWNIEIKAL